MQKVSQDSNINQSMHILDNLINSVQRQPTVKKSRGE